MIPNTHGWKYTRNKGMVKPTPADMDTQGGSQLDFLSFHLMNGKWRKNQ